MSEEPWMHWFAFTYTGTCTESGKQCHASTYTGYPERRITLARIEENKDHAKVEDDAVLLSVSYLGNMTRSEFLRGSSKEGQRDA